MKSLLLLPLFIILSAPSQAQQVNDFCEQTKYREVYNPGYYDGYGNYVPGRVTTESYKERCYNTSRYQPTYQQAPKQESCRPTSALLGALIGGGVAAGVSKSDAYGWSVPLGAVGGGLLGCSL